MSNSGQKERFSGTSPEYEPYDEYKKIESELVGKIPSHWDLTVIKRCYEVQVGKALQTEQEAPNEEKLPYLKSRHVGKDGGFELDDLPQMWFSPDERNKYTLQQGDLLVLEGGDVGRGGVWPGSDREILYQNAINRLRPRKDNNSEYLYYWVQWLKEQGYIDVLCNKATIPHYTVETVSNTPLLVPTPEEQASIVSFLNYHTSRIRELIKKKKKLLGLLDDRREAAITHAVMKGIDQDTEMVDSGVDWVGEIPAHWDSVRIGSLIEEVKHPVEVEEDEVYQEIGIRSHGKGIFHKEPVTGGEIGSKNVFWVVENALIFNIVFAWEGAVALTSEDEEGMIASHRFPMFVPRDEDISLKYLKYFFTHGYGQGILDWNSPGAAGRNRTLNRGAMLSEEFWMPPSDEQHRIAQYISNVVTLIDELSDTIQRGVELLNEKRQSLITQAVSGEIDLRGWEPSDESEQFV